MMPANEMPERWAIWIDIEGFSFLHENYNPQALLLLGRLIEDIFRIGSQVYTESPERLFIHQIGDGFIIVSDFMEDSLERPIAIAVTLMRSLLTDGGLARAGISSGDFADILGCFPHMIQDAMKDGGLPVGSGRMSVTQVMGGALINAHHTAHDGPKGPSLRIDSKLADKLANIEDLIITERSDQSIGINWLTSSLQLADTLAQKIRGQLFVREQLEKSLGWYLNEFETHLSGGWKRTAEELLGHKS